MTRHLSPPVANIFGRKLLGFADSPDWRILVGFSVNSTYSVLFSSSPKEKSSTFMLWCSWRTRRQKYWDRSHQTVWTRTCGLPIPRLLSDFLPSSCCRSSLAFPSRTFFEHSVANDGIFVLFLCKVSVDSSNHHTKAIRVVIVPILLMNCCIKLLEDFVQDLRFVLFDTFVTVLLSRLLPSYL